MKNLLVLIFATTTLQVVAQFQFNSQNAFGIESDFCQNGATGNYSFAAGWNSEASGASSIAIGENNSASGVFSTSIGVGTSALGQGSLSLGSGTQAQGWYSSALGFFSNSVGDYSFAVGSQTQALGIYSVATGANTTASGYASTALGDATIASGRASTANGAGTTAEDYGTFSIGIWNEEDSSPNPSQFAYSNTAFVIGNGIDEQNKSNALEVTFDGTMTLAGDLNINSDANLKANIISLGNTMTNLLLIDGKKYNLKKDPLKNTKIGVLAQDVELAFPELVSEVNGIKSVNYQGLIPVLINALKDQNDKLLELEEKVKVLTALLIK